MIFPASKIQTNLGLKAEVHSRIFLLSAHGMLCAAGEAVHKGKAVFGDELGVRLFAFPADDKFLCVDLYFFVDLAAGYFSVDDQSFAVLLAVGCELFEQKFREMLRIAAER